MRPDCPNHRLEVECPDDDGAVLNHPLPYSIKRPPRSCSARRPSFAPSSSRCQLNFSRPEPSTSLDRDPGLTVRTTAVRVKLKGPLWRQLGIHPGITWPLGLELSGDSCTHSAACLKLEIVQAWAHVSRKILRSTDANSLRRRLASHGPPLAQLSRREITATTGGFQPAPSRERKQK